MKSLLKILSTIIILTLVGCIGEDPAPHQALSKEPSHIYSEISLNDNLTVLVYEVESNKEILVSTVEQGQNKEWNLVEKLELGEPVVSNENTVLEGTYVEAGFINKEEEAPVDYHVIRLDNTTDLDVWINNKND